MALLTLAQNDGKLVKLLFFFLAMILIIVMSVERLYLTFTARLHYPLFSVEEARP